ncbi:BnaC04g56190D [Brassica napus]|uniref:BnaC04g56190D protein n=1 Tax=Brassica napus TaxID=3708 RepID=A0A078JH79_BRANA|nr:BnaC04g56190D [Brassica napus]
MAYNTRFFLFATTALLLALNISGRIIPEATADPTNIAARLNGGGLMEKPTSSVASVSLQIPVVLPLLLPLEKFDHIHMWLKRNPTERVTFYRLTDSFRDSFYSDILPKLERSLSLALIHFLPLSGHLKWNPQDPKPHIVVLQQDTVSLTVAESSADFSCIPTKGCVPKLSYALWCPSYQFPLTPHLSCLSRSLSSRTKASPSEPPSTMLPSWTDKRRQNRSIINVPAGLEPKILELMSYLEKGSARSLKLPSFKELNDVVRITLELSQENVDKLKEREPRTSQLTFAYVWTCMVKTHFGWGRPVNTEIMSIYGNNQISMSARRDGTGGVEIGVSLKKREMDVVLLFSQMD